MSEQARFSLTSARTARRAASGASALALAIVLGDRASADFDANTWIGMSSGSWYDARSWSLGIVPWNDGRSNFLAIIPEPRRGDFAITIGSGMPVISALSVGASASLDILAGAGLEMSGGSIDNNGTIGLWGLIGEPAMLQFAADDANLYGAGTIIGGGGAAVIRAANPTGHLMHVKGHRIEGALRLGADSLRLRNEGEIVANNGTLTVDLTDGAGFNSNSGVMRAVDGARLEIVDCEIDNTDGVIEAQEGSMVRFGKSLPRASSVQTHIIGGMLRSDASDSPGRLEVTEILRISGGVRVEGPLHLLLPHAITPTNPPTLWIGEDAQIPSIVILKGIASQSLSARLLFDAPVATFTECIVYCESTVLGPMAWLGGYGSLATAAVIEQSATLSGGFLFDFKDGVINRGRIEGGAKDTLRVYWSGQVLENAPTGSIDYAAPIGAYHEIWSAGLLNHGSVNFAGERTITMGSAGFSQDAGSASFDGTLQFNSSAPPVRVHGGVLAGAGSIAKRTENLGGVMAPGSAGGVGTVGTLSITLGEFVQGAAGTLDVDLGAAADSMVNPGDRLAITGAAQLDGTLRVRLVDGFVPTAGETFVVLTASSVSGVFASVESAGHCQPFEVIYAPTNVSVVFAGTGGADFNDDGVIDGDDLGSLLGMWGDCERARCPADLNGDGVVDGDDLSALLGAWT